MFIQNPEGKRPLGSQGRRREDNIKVGFDGVEWINIAHDRGRDEPL
jgi:hypothetical protein